MPDTADIKTVSIDVLFDPICPWCFIGKRRLDEAIRQRPGLRVQRRWRPFLLNPEMPREGLDRTAYLVRKFGSEERVRRVYGAIEEAGLSVEIDFAFHRIKQTPNTVDAHRLMRFADQSGKADATAEALFHCFFINAENIGERRVLLDISAALELDVSAVSRYLDSDRDVDVIYEENAEAHRMGINGVPSYLFNGIMAISGAQEPPVLARMLDAALATG
ncbi:MAG: DsbA family oxidoreductase [Rhodospirillales bacterium]